MCRKLEIVSYHPDVISAEGENLSHTHSAKEAVVPILSACAFLSPSTYNPHRVYVQVQITRNDINAETDSLLVAYDPQVEKDTGLQVGSTLLQSSRKGFS